MQKREKQRDTRDFDTTQLKLSGHGKSLHRDYSAHFFRWSFARRFINAKTNVLDIGCGEEYPLARILTGGAAAYVKEYVGCDINKLKPSNRKNFTLYGEFDFTENWNTIAIPKGGFDVIVCFEVIEHMKIEHGKKLLQGAYELLNPGGTFIISTPCYDGVRHAANHIHEYTIDELGDAITEIGFNVDTRYGAFMDIKHIKKSEYAIVYGRLAKYFDNDALSCIFAPLFPDYSRNNLWVCTKGN